MSRTRKHSPYWVQSADHGTREWHRHELFGQPVTVNRRLRDQRGRLLTDSRPVRMSIERILTLELPADADPATRARYFRAFDEARHLRSAGTPSWKLIDGPFLRSVTRTMPVVIGHYADYCTIGEHTDRDFRIKGTPELYAPCIRELGPQEEASVFPRGGERGYGIYRDRRFPTRRTTGNATRTLTRHADDGLELDDAVGAYTR